MQLAIKPRLELAVDFVPVAIRSPTVSLIPKNDAFDTVSSVVLSLGLPEAGSLASSADSDGCAVVIGAVAVGARGD